jgi:hypothetical protein
MILSQSNASGMMQEGKDIGGFRRSTAAMTTAASLSAEDAPFLLVADARDT